jgi:hypothetical protein
MKKVIFLMFFLSFLVVMPLVGTAGDVNISIGLTPPPPPPPEGQPEVEALPPEQFAEPPDVVAVPSGTSYVYMVPNTVGLYFYNDYWYRFNRGYWYRSDIYSGPWTYIGVSLVPQVIVDIPPEYPLYLPPRYHRIHYYDLHRHWRQWDRNRHWNRYDWFRHELRNDVRRDRFRRIETERRRHPRGEGQKPPPRDVRHPRGEGQKPPPGDIRHPRGERQKPPPGDVRKPKGEKKKPEREQQEQQGQERRQHEQR